jgi:hypothetical protein
MSEVKADGTMDDFLRQFAPGDSCAQLPSGRGRFGFDKTNPIPGDAYRYLKALRCPSGHTLDYYVRGNVGPGPDGHLVDRFELFCERGEYKVKLHFDCYHPGVSALVPEGLALGGSVPGKHPSERDDLFNRFAEGVRASVSARKAAFFISDWLRANDAAFVSRVGRSDPLIEAVGTLHHELDRLESITRELQERVCLRPFQLGHLRWAKMTMEEYYLALAHGVEKRFLCGKKPPEERPASPTGNL